MRAKLFSITKKLPIAALCMALLGAALPGEAQETSLKFTLDWRFDGPGSIVLLPAAKGYFKQEGLDVTIDSGSGSAAAVQRVASGSYDIGFADLSSLVEYLSKNPTAPRLQAVYVVLEQAPAAVFALKSSGIKVPADLVGKTVGAPVFDAGRKAWPLFAQANKIDPQKVNWTNADPAMREALLHRGDLDAITGFYYTSLLNLNARGIKDEDLVIFKYADHGVNLYGNAVIVSPKLAAENPEAVKKFLRALNRGIKETIKNPEAAVAYVKSRDPLIDVAVETKRLKYFLDHFVATPAAKAKGLSTVDPERLASNLQQINSAFGLTNPVSPQSVFNPAFLPALTDRKF